MWDEAKKFFAAGSKRHPEVAEVAKDLALADVSMGEFLTCKFTLWVDLRTTDDDRLRGSGRRIENASEGVTIQITKQAEAAGALNIYLYVIMDAQLNTENSKFITAIYWIFCPMTPKRQSSDRQVAEKQFSSLICLKAPTARSFTTSWSCAPRCGTTRLITSTPGRTLRSTL